MSTSTSLDYLRNNMPSLPPLTEDDVNDWMALANPSQPLNFGTDDLASFAFAPLDLGLGSSMPSDVPAQAQAPLVFGAGDLALYNFSVNIGVAVAYGGPVMQPSPFFQMGLGGAPENPAVPHATGSLSLDDAQPIEYGATLLQASAVDGSNGFPYNAATVDPNATSSLGPLVVAGPQTGPPAIDSEEPRASDENFDQWIDYDGLLNDTQPAGVDVETGTSPIDLPAVLAPSSTFAVLLGDPSVPRQPSPGLDGEEWLQGGELFWTLNCQSNEALAHTSPSIASPGSDDEPAPTANIRPQSASGHSYDADASSAQHREQLGLHVQEDNKEIAPAVTGRQPKTPHAAKSSRKPAVRKSTPSKAGRSSKVRAQKETKVRASTSRLSAPKKPKNPFPRVPWEKTERGRRCKELKLTEDKPGPFQCFVCVEHGAPGASKVYTKWKTFKSHVGRCAPLERMLPRCHFCRERIAAYGRPHQMERHLVGYDGYPPCKVLAGLVRAGRTTHFALGSWLKDKGRPILPEFVGRRLAQAFHWAIEDGWEREKVADLTPQHRKKKKQANKDEAENIDEEEVDESDDDDD